MSQLIDYSFKDSTPEETVAQIRSILNSHGITTTEIWQEANIPNCYAMSVCIEGTTLRSNGKGVTRQLAQASGYGELMERLQMGITGSAESQKASLQPEVSQLKQVRADELWQETSDWYEALSQKLAACTGQTMSPKEILQRFIEDNGMISVREFVMPGGKTALFPAKIIQRVYCTNGCAAGNSAEEAIVQAISEIIERHHQLRIVHENLVPPVIPEDALMRCAKAWSIICFLRENGFRVQVRDCSFGKPFPVVCVCLVDQNNGRYHTHFGAFPVFEIALERALTESFQGRTLETVAQFQQLSTKKPGQHDLAVIGSEVFFGSCEKTSKFFCGTADFEYNCSVGFLGRDNKQLLDQCIHYLKDAGYDILIQDHSALGFPTYQVLIPGISEVMIHRLHPKLDDTRYSSVAATALRQPASASIPDAMSLLMHLNQLDQFGAKVRNSRDFSFCSRLPLKLDRSESESLMILTLCYFHYAMGRRNEVLQGLDRLLCLPCVEHPGKLLCLRRYFALLQRGYDQQTISQLLNKFHPEDFRWLQECLSQKKNPFDDFVLHCDLESCDQCAMRNRCCYQANRSLGDLIITKTAKLDFAGFIRFMQGF